MTDSDYEAKIERSNAKKTSQTLKKLSERCYCGKKGSRHTNIEGMRCRKLKESGKAGTVGSIMTEEQINKGRFQKI